MRRWILTSAILGALALAGCEEDGADVDLDLGESPDIETTEVEMPATAEPEVEDETVTDVRPSAGAAQHPPPEDVEVEPAELPEERVAGAAQHPLPEDAVE